MGIMLGNRGNYRVDSIRQPSNVKYLKMPGKQRLIQDSANNKKVPLIRKTPNRKLRQPAIKQMP